MTPRRVAVPRHPVTVDRVTYPISLGEDDRAVETRRIVREQGRVAALTLAVVGAVLIGLPLLLDGLSPAVVWLVLSAGVQPFWIALALHHLWRAERVERDRVRTPR